MLCFLTRAYINHIVHYIIFNALPGQEQSVQAQRNLTFLAALTVVNDSESLQEQLVEVSHEEVHLLLQRFSVTTAKRLTWKS